MTTRTEGSVVTTYSYSIRGELLSVTLADGRAISYEYDPPGRRIAKCVDGVIVEKYLWQGLTKLHFGLDNLLVTVRICAV